MRAAALEHTDVNEFIVRHAMHAADEVIGQSERIELSRRDTRLWLDLLDKPPTANARLITAAKARSKTP